LWGLKEDSFMPAFVNSLWPHRLWLNLPFLVFLGVGRLLVEPDDPGRLLLFGPPGWLLHGFWSPGGFLIAPVCAFVLELDFCAVEESDWWCFLRKLEGLTVAEQHVFEIDLLAHAFLAAIDFEGHLHVYLLAVEGVRVWIEGQSGEQTERFGEGDAFVRIGEFDGVSLVHLHCALAALCLFGTLAEDGDLHLKHFFEFDFE
jgi:diadenosine tetraphosphatase ApaH/serine/threonine PP2A family protein phosphatase